MSAAAARFKLKRNKRLNILWHPESFFIFNNGNVNRKVIGRYVNKEHQPLLSKWLDECKEWGFEYDPDKVVYPEEEEEETEEVEEVEEDDGGGNEEEEEEEEKDGVEEHSLSPEEEVDREEDVDREEEEEKSSEEVEENVEEKVENPSQPPLEENVEDNVEENVEDNVEEKVEDNVEEKVEEKAEHVEESTPSSRCYTTDIRELTHEYTSALFGSYDYLMMKHTAAEEKLRKRERELEEMTKQHSELLAAFQHLSREHSTLQEEHAILVAKFNGIKQLFAN